MDNRPCVSVIVPIYNQEDYLQECLDTLLAQTLANAEFVCINDGSTDSSLSILVRNAEKDSRIVVVDQENMGVGKSRNKGITIAKGEYVIFCDPDDFYPSDDVLSSLYEAAKSNNALAAGGCFSDYDVDSGAICDKFDGTLDGYTFEEPGWVEYSDYQFDFGFHRFVFNREFLIQNGLFFPEYLRFQDPPFLVEALYAAQRFYAIDKVVYRYRYGHVFPKWNRDKRIDLARGLRDNLLFSLAHDLPKLHSLTVSRILNEYRHVLSRGIDNYGSFYILSSLTGCINSEYLTDEQKEQVKIVRELVVLPALKERMDLLKKLEKKNEKLEQELQKAKKKNADLRKSKAFRIGSKITSIARPFKK